MALSINTNFMSLNAARSLNTHYGNLSASTRRLSSGLRVGSAADDAAGLAIRELMRSDITTLNQGIRNANDAISMIQTADGALGVIDEKLIRMKELAEQASTGTYNSIQRLIIDSEYQQMADEISRIANATDFNGLNILNGDLESGYHSGKEMASTGKLKVHFGTGNSSAEDYYYVQIEDMTAEGLSVGDNGTVEVAREKLLRKYELLLEESLQPRVDAGEITQADYDAAIIEVRRATKFWGEAACTNFATDTDFENGFKDTFGATTVPRDDNFKGPEGFTYTYLDGMENGNYSTMHDSYKALTGDEKEKWKYAFLRQAMKNEKSTLADGSIFGGVPGGFAMNIPAALQADVQKAGIEATQWFEDRHTYAGQNIRTQENAQHALGGIDDAIVIKDNIRASLGATQNRLENTITNLQIQAENLQASESRISDVDVAAEMPQFVRNQILTQASVAMLSQANSFPKMALNLIS